MGLKLIQSWEDTLPLKPAWNDLLKSSASHVPFLRHEFLETWWNTLGGGEWPGGDLAVVIRENSSGEIDAIAPLFREGSRVLFLGSFEIADYLDLITQPENLPAFCAELLEFSLGENFPSWDQLDLYNLPENSPSIPLLESAAEKFGLAAETSVLQPAPGLQLPASWDAYLETLEAHYRGELNRKLQNAAGYFLPVDWYISGDQSSLDSELDQFLELMANHPQKKEFLTPAMVKQIKTSATAAFREGWLQLAFLVVGDIKAAGYLNFDFDNKIWVYNSGINPLFENLSPGWVLLGRLIEWAIQNGRSELDFMRGDEAYKTQLGGTPRNVLRLKISRN